MHPFVDARPFGGKAKVPVAAAECLDEVADGDLQRHHVHHEVVRDHDDRRRIGVQYAHHTESDGRPVVDAHPLGQLIEHSGAGGFGLGGGGVEEEHDR